MAKTCTFKKDQDLERIDVLLAGKRVRNKMPDKIRGKRAPMVLWAIEYLAKLIKAGVNNLQAELFSDSTEEWEVITCENEQLKAAIERLKTENKNLIEQICKLQNLEEGYVKDLNRLIHENTELTKQLKTILNR